MSNTIYSIPKSKQSGIYMIYNMTNHKAYIGQTSNFKKRAIQHSMNLYSGKHSNKELQKDYDNGCQFAFTILENTIDNHSFLLLREKMYMYAFLRKYIKLYNHETEQDLKDSLFSDFVYPEIDNIHTLFHENFKCPISNFHQCKPETVLSKIQERGVV